MVTAVLVVLIEKPLIYIGFHIGFVRRKSEFSLL
jgi:hypothetical protein